VAVRSKMWVCGRSVAGNLGSNPAGGHGCLSWVCCQVEVSASVRSLIQGNPTKRGVSECHRGVSLTRRPWSTVGTCLMEERKSYRVHDFVTMILNMNQSRQLHTFNIYASKIYFNINILRRHIENRKLLLICILLLPHSFIFFRFLFFYQYMDLFLSNTVIYVFLL